jgi:excisionase family DNA binding protein
MTKKTTELLSIQSAAERLGISTRTLRTWVWRRRVNSVHIGRCVRIPTSEIARLTKMGFRKASHSQGCAR